MILAGWIIIIVFGIISLVNFGKAGIHIKAAESYGLIELKEEEANERAYAALNISYCGLWMNFMLLGVLFVLVGGLT